MRTEDTEADAARFRGERLKVKGLEKWRAIQRMVGSTILGSVAAWKLIQYEPSILVEGESAGVPWALLVWIGLAMISFGLASWDQITKAIRR